MKKYSSWGTIVKPKFIKEVKNVNVNIFNSDNNTFLAYGKGRSYGDVCLNSKGNIVNTQNLNKIVDINQKEGVLTVESGVTIKEILSKITKDKYFLPVVPGTQNVTIGGAIANDIHGKNHHKRGSFGNFIISLKLLRSNGEILQCSEIENKDLFYATIGGLGLTGIILSASIKLLKIESNYIDGEIKRFSSLKEFWKLNTDFENKYEYSVGWIDLQSKKEFNVRGVFICGNHSNKAIDIKKNRNVAITFPFIPPFSFVNNFSLKLLNHFYFNIQKDRNFQSQHFRKFFFPLDTINYWNRAYGKKGFFQYQFVIPKENSDKTLNEIFQVIKGGNQTAALGVIKTFGSIKSKGIISFPREGVTVALDFQNKGENTLELFEKLDKIVLTHEGALYPAKDFRMPKEVFEKSFKDYDKFSKFIDPKFNSDFITRVLDH